MASLHRTMISGNRGSRLSAKCVHDDRGSQKQINVQSTKLLMKENPRESPASQSSYGTGKLLMIAAHLGSVNADERAVLGGNGEDFFF